MKKSQIVLIAGLVVLLVGAVMTFTSWKEYANYVLIAGVLLVFLRGSIRMREKDEENKPDENGEDKDN